MSSGEYAVYCRATTVRPLFDVPKSRCIESSGIYQHARMGASVPPANCANACRAAAVACARVQSAPVLQKPSARSIAMNNEPHMWSSARMCARQKYKHVHRGHRKE